jgi:hypothetical protein
MNSPQITSETNPGIIMPQAAVDKSRTKNDWHNKLESPMHFSLLRASGQGLFSLYMLFVGVEGSSL